MIDLHCHILPGVDDGSKSWDMTVEMCRIAKQDGITHMVATPHANHRYAFHREHHLERLDELKRRVPDLDFSLGCDFHVSYENVEDAISHPARYTIAGTRYVLVEFSDYQTPHQMTESLFRLHSAGLSTIVTHPERNPVIDQYPDLPHQFVDMGAALQITAGSLYGSWGRKPKKTCQILLKKGLVAIIATDAHEPKLRKPILSEARKAASKIVGNAAADVLVRANPCAVLNNHPLV
jgi:protein-tyrosine phosphatase